MHQFDHPNIIKLIGVCPSSPMSIVMELAEFGEVRLHPRAIFVIRLLPREQAHALLGNMVDCHVGNLSLIPTGYLYQLAVLLQHFRKSCTVILACEQGRAQNY